MIEAPQLGLAEASHVIAAGASSPTDWIRIIAELSIATVALYFLFQLHRDIVQKIIPDGFALIAEQIQTLETIAQDRHAEHMVEMKATRKAIEAMKKAVDFRPPRRKGRVTGLGSVRRKTTRRRTKSATKSRR